MKSEIVYYADCWFKVEYSASDYNMDFIATRIEGMNEENMELSTFGQSESIKGNIKWDGCMNFVQDDHYCGLVFAEYCLQLMTHIYKYAAENIAKWDSQCTSSPA